MGDTKSQEWQLMSDIEYLRCAYRVAETFSDDRSTQNGAILVDHVNYVVPAIVAYAANQFMPEIEDCPQRHERPLKYKYYEHAERNVLYSAAAAGIKTSNLFMYCPWIACADCARAIVRFGIDTVVTHDFELHNSRDDWKETVRIGREILEESGVIIRYVKEKIGGVKIRFGGVIVEP